MHKKTTTTVEEYYDHGSIKLTQAFLIRLLEWAKIDAKDDTEIHHVVEKMASMDHHKIFIIDDFDSIIGSVTPVPTK